MANAHYTGGSRPLLAGGNADRIVAPCAAPLSSLPLQVLLYFNQWLSIGWMIVELILIAWKGSLMPPLSLRALH
jgi:hypothetical protein